MTYFRRPHIFSDSLLLPTSTYFQENFVLNHFSFIFVPLGGQSDNHIKQESDFLLFCFSNSVLQNRYKDKGFKLRNNTFKYSIKKGRFTILCQLS
jgi:hypothetical protein